ncbi:MAG: hypothetical protein COT18_02245, partial [Elusimicrobia bacterium CG08_land_8_20_14_0_20_59_10]
TTNSVVNVSFGAVRNTTYGGFSPTEEVSSSNPNWKLLNSNPIDWFMAAGDSYATIYVWDTLVGVATITVSGEISADSFVFPTVTQGQLITPDKASYFTLHHGYTLATPLRVLQAGTINLRARDRFGNVAAGDSVNGQYYKGKIVMATNSQGTASIKYGVAPYPTFYTFVEADQGETDLMLEDSYVETLKINVTDYFTPSVYGYTSDSARGLPQQSAGDVVLSGMVITPTDLAPEDPLPVSKISIGLNRTSLYQGDGLIEDIPAPVAMIRMAMRTAPTGTPPAYLKSLQVKSTGSLSYGDIAEIALYDDNKEAGQLGMFDGETELGGPPVDVFISSGVYDPGLMAWKFDDLNVKLSTAVLISNLPRNYFLAIRVSTTAVTPKDFGLMIDNPSLISLDSSFVGVAENNFPIRTSTSPVRNQPAMVHIKGTDIAAWWQPTIGTTTMPLAQYAYVDQGQPGVGMLRLQAWTDNFAGTIKSFRIIKTGTGSGTQINNMRIYLDSENGDWTLGDCHASTVTCNFQPSIDKEITDTLNPPVHDPEDTELFVLSIQDPRAYGEVDESTRTFFITFEFSSDAIPDTTHGARLETSGVSLLDGAVGAFSPISSSTVPVKATNDTVYLVDVNASGVNGFSVPTSLTQNDVNKAIAKLTMRVNGTRGSAVWKGLKLDRWITAGENGETPCYNKSDDVTKISVWQDSNGNGLFESPESTAPVKDEEVLLVSARNRVFPTGILASALTAADNSIQVKNIQDFFYSDSPFDMAPGRLVINDNQSDPTLKEVVYYSTVNVMTNTFGGVTRGAEGTPAAVWSSGTVISGQAVLPLVGDGASDGQVLYTTAKDYFVTFNLNPLANVSNFSYVGVAMRTTDYFYIDAPKQMSTANVGTVDPGKSISLVSKVREYPDKIIVESTEAVTGPTLQQKALNQPVIDLTLKTPVGDAYWYWLMVYATGTVVDEGSALNDVETVKVWYDKDDNGFMDVARDVMVGAGAFGNTRYGPLVARVDFSTTALLLTESEADNRNIAQKFFITYDMTEAAMPNDSFGNPRRIGAYLKTDSFPQGNSTADDPARNAFSWPNSLSTVTFVTFESMLREIISAPSTVTVVTEQLFVSTSGVEMAAPLVAQLINSPGPQDAAWIVNTTSGMPSEGYLSVDGEIIHYSSITANNLVYVDRGQFSSPITNHQPGATLGGEIYQGYVNWPMMKLSINTNGYGVRWQGVKFFRTQPGALTGYDSDVKEIRIWKDNGNGTFDRDPVTGENRSDILVGSGRFGVADPVGKATIYVIDPALKGQEYVVVGATPTVYFVSLSIDIGSNFSHEALTPPNDIVGIEVQDETGFIAGKGGPQCGHA